MRRFTGFRAKKCLRSSAERSCSMESTSSSSSRVKATPTSLRKIDDKAGKPTALRMATSPPLPPFPPPLLLLLVVVVVVVDRDDDRDAVSDDGGGGGVNAGSPGVAKARAARAALLGGDLSTPVDGSMRVIFSTGVLDRSIDRSIHSFRGYHQVVHQSRVFEVRLEQWYTFYHECHANKRLIKMRINQSINQSIALTVQKESN